MKKGYKLRKLYKILARVRSWQTYMEELTDEELSGLTEIFKQRLAEGESLDDILPEAFAAVCEADKRVLGMEPFDVQVLGGVALHKGYLAEMNTGEGKTLVATMPLYLNALTGKSVILVTANDYLARRDAEEMGGVYRFMGLTVAAGVPRDAGERFSNEEKQEIYKADIVYTTHSILGFDYLLNNLVQSARDRFLREFYYVIIDEADSVLLDAAQMPLVISGSPRVQSNLYEMTDFFVSTLVEDEDYEKEEKAVWLTEKGVAYAESFFCIDNFYGEEYFEIHRHVTLALRAHALFENTKNYVVTGEEELVLLDSGSGRMMPGVKLRGGQHQALEVKEGIEPSREMRSVAAITYQSLFLLFPKMAGMSGTLADASAELLDVYGAEVVKIPPNHPVQRKDLPDVYCNNADRQFTAAVYKVLELHEKGQPVLVVVSSIAETELVSKLLMERKVPHNVLNANNIAWEAEIIREAGRKSAVTVATSIAGRGTDIRLGEGVQELGGLAVIGIGRMANTRLERQARGRAGRQGDPGSSRFFVSLEDEVVQDNGSRKLDRYIENRRRIRRRKLKRIIDSSQFAGEERSVLSRKQAVDYDRILQRQRDMIYEIRNRLLDGGVIPREKVLEIARGNIRRFLDSQSELDTGLLNRYLLDHISYHLDQGISEDSLGDREAVEEFLLNRVKQGLAEQEKNLSGKRQMEMFMRIAALDAVDNAWVEQVDYLQQLQAAVPGRASAQRNPVFEYQKEARESFHRMELIILKDIVRNILLSNVYIENRRLKILLP